MIEPEVPEVDRLAAHVGKTAALLARRYREDRPDAVSALAILRRGVSREPGSDPQVAAWTTAGLYSADARLPAQATRAERAAHTALTLFGMHQQSLRDRAMHDDTNRFGQSVRALGLHLGEGSQQAVRRRFLAIATAQTSEEMSHHARGLIQQLRAARIPLDYGSFSRDLYWLQTSHTADRVRRQWGRDFYRTNDPAGRVPEEADAAGDTSESSPSESE